MAAAPDDGNPLAPCQQLVTAKQLGPRATLPLSKVINNMAEALHDLAKKLLSQRPCSAGLEQQLRDQRAAEAAKGAEIVAKEAKISSLEEESESKEGATLALQKASTRVKHCEVRHRAEERLVCWLREVISGLLLH